MRSTACYSSFCFLWTYNKRFMHSLFTDVAFDDVIAVDWPSSVGFGIC